MVAPLLHLSEQRNPLHDVHVEWSDERQLGDSEIRTLLQRFGELLDPPLSHRVAVADFAGKVRERAQVARAFIDGETVGLLVMYANDPTTRRAHVPIVAVLPHRCGLGVGKALMSRALARARQKGMTSIDLEVSANNSRACRLYSGCGFRVAAASGSRLNMVRALPAPDLNWPPTPIDCGARLADAFGLDIDLRIKRDDLFPITGGGSKGRKMRYIIRAAVERGHDVIVTNGAPQSNHARSAAVACAELGIHCHLVLVLEPGVAYPETGNLLLMRMAGASIETCEKAQLSERMDKALDSFRGQGHDPLYVWGGGHSPQGTLALAAAVSEARAQCAAWEPEFVITASGTGSTQAGLAIGFADSGARVIGISVARDANRGSAAVHECVDEYRKASLDSRASLRPVEVEFRADWTDGGYARKTAALHAVTAIAARAGLFVDTTYSGKALRGLVDLARNGEIPRGSRVLFWHTGGLLNLGRTQFVSGEGDPPSVRLD